MALWIAGVFFAGYMANVTIGATTNAPVLNNVQEMILLWLASIAFVVEILRRERIAKGRDDDR